jgi:hypothetical protein
MKQLKLAYHGIAVVAACYACLISGCAKFPAHRVDLCQWYDIPRIGHRMPVCYTVRRMDNGIVAHDYGSTEERYVRDLLVKSALFESVSGQDTSNCLSLSIEFERRDPTSIGSTIGFFASVLTMTLVPARWQTDLVLRVDVKNGAGDVTHYEYADSVVNWMWIGLFFSGSQIDEVTPAVEQNMFRMFLRDLASKSPGQEGVGAKRAPRGGR